MSLSTPLVTTLELGALPSAVGCARAHAKYLLREWGLAEVGDEVELLVSELVTNAVKATCALNAPIRPPVWLRMLSDYQRVLIEVWDASAEPPIPTDADSDALGGRGLFLVEMFSRKWAWCFTPQWGGKVVWCEVAA